MPTLPFDDRATVAPVGGVTPYQRGDFATPEKFGAFEAQGLARMGGAFEQTGDMAARQALALQKDYNETATDAANTAFEGNVRPIVGDFSTLRGEDAMRGRADTLTKIEQLRQSTRESLTNPEQKKLFDYLSRRAQSRYLNEVEFHAAREQKVWMGDTAKGAIVNEVNNSGTYWDDDQRFAESIGNIKIQASKLLRLQGVDPESDAGKAQITHYTSEAWSARIRSVMAQDAGTARQLFDANADYLDAAHRASLDAQLTSHQYTQMVRDDMQSRRAEADARRNMETQQAATLAKLTADTLGGKPPSTGSMAELVRTQQLAPHAAEFVLSLAKRRTAGPDDDNATAVISLHKTLNDSTLSIDDKMAAITAASKGGYIKAATAGALVDRAYNGEMRGDNVVARQALSATLAAVGAPDGMINLSHEEKQRKAQVLVEWGNRVTVGNEDPTQVRDELIERYAPPGTPPATWARPKFGTVTSSADVQAVAQQTRDALAAGRITPSAAAQEGVLLKQYADFYQRLDAARAAATAARKAQPANTSSNKAKLRGVSATQEGG
jgi:hypothetical protein